MYSCELGKIICLIMRFIIFMYWKLHVIINVKQYISPFIIHWGYAFVEFRQIIFNYSDSSDVHDKFNLSICVLGSQSQCKV